MKVELCDRCKRRPALDRFVMDAEGIHKPAPSRRQDGMRFVGGCVLCESCSVSLRYHWGVNADKDGGT